MGRNIARLFEIIVVITFIILDIVHNNNYGTASIAFAILALISSIDYIVYSIDHKRIK